VCLEMTVQSRSCFRNFILLAPRKKKDKKRCQKKKDGVAQKMFDKKSPRGEKRGARKHRRGVSGHRKLQVIKVPTSMQRSRSEKKTAGLRLSKDTGRYKTGLELGVKNGAGPKRKGVRGKAEILGGG